MRCPARGIDCDCLDCELHRLRLAMSWDTPRAFARLDDIREDEDAGLDTMGDRVRDSLPPHHLPGGDSVV